MNPAQLKTPNPSNGLAAIWSAFQAQLVALLGSSAFALEQAYVQRRSGVTTPAALATGVPYWLLARSMVRVRTVSIPKLDSRKWQSAVALELSSWEPFTQSAYYVLPQSQGATLFAWDAATVEAAIQGAGLTEVNVVPEAALRASHGDGLRIIESLEGVEGQFAPASGAAISQWWPANPSPTEWRSFERLAGTPALESVPAALPAPAWLRVPAGYAASMVKQVDHRAEWLWIAAISFAMAIPTLWYANEARVLFGARQDAEARLAATEKELDGVLSARGAALDAQGRAATLARLFSLPDVALVSAQVAEMLGSLANPQTFQLTDWEWRERKVKLTMQMNPGVNAPPVTQLVRAFESMAAYAGVKIIGEGARISIEFEVLKNSTMTKP